MRSRSWAARDADTIVLTIANKGAQIPASAYDSIFEPLYRLPTEAVPDAQPTDHVGLGLFIVKQIVDGHGRIVAVASYPARTAFTVRLPDAQPAPAALVAPAAPASDPG